MGVGLGLGSCGGVDGLLRLLGAEAVGAGAGDGLEGGLGAVAMDGVSGGVGVDGGSRWLV